MKIELESIGTIHTEFSEIEGMPIQPTGAKGIKGKIVIKDKYVDGLKDLENFSHINIIYDDSCQEGYTVEYAQNDGSLVLTITRNSTGTAPSTLSGTIYIDNSMDNATK